MVFQRIISRFPGRTRIAVQFQRLNAPKFRPSVDVSDQASKPFSQITQKRDLFSRTSNYGGPTHVLYNAMPKIFGNLGMKSSFPQVHSLPTSIKFASFIHSISQNEFERGMNNKPIETDMKSGSSNGSSQRSEDMSRSQPPFETGRNTKYFEGLSRRLSEMDRNRAPLETSQDNRPFWRDIGKAESDRTFMSRNFLSGILKDNQNDSSQNYRSGFEQNADIVHIKLMRNNTFVTVTDSKGNKKMGASAGCLAEMKGGPKVSKYAAEATAEHVGRLARSMGLKSVVMKVNGFTFFKRKKLAILSFRDGYTHSRSDRNPIVYIEDTTRKPHNGCRLRKQRRV